MPIWEWILLGIVQGLSEWLPISSEGMLVLTQTLILGSSDLEEQIGVALWLHLGTWLAAVVYLRKEVAELITSLLNWKQSTAGQKSILRFLIISTIISAGLGGLMLIFLDRLSGLETAGIWVTGVVGGLLVITGVLQMKSKNTGTRSAEELDFGDGLLLGILQGLAALPGFSRSGLTVSGLLLRKIDKVLALKLSFLMSLPIILGGNILLSWDEGNFTQGGLAGLTSSFIIGFITIDWFMKIAEKVNFGKFVIWMGVLVIISALIMLLI